MVIHSVLSTSFLQGCQETRVYPEGRLLDRGTSEPRGRGNCWTQQRCFFWKPSAMKGTGWCKGTAIVVTLSILRLSNRRGRRTILCNTRQQKLGPISQSYRNRLSSFIKEELSLQTPQVSETLDIWGIKLGVHKGLCQILNSKSLNLRWWTKFKVKLHNVFKENSK